MDFTAIDFETANRHRDSACQLAAVRVRGGTIVDKAMWMIRPTPMFFAPGNIRVHGITPDRVAGESTFGELWPDIAAKLDGETIIAHNASFDIGVLRACLITHRCDVPELSYGCTRAVARRTWPQRPKFGLKPLAQWLGIEFRHHDALEDSIACAKILLAAAVDLRADSMEQLEQKLGLRRGAAGDWGTSGPSASRSTNTLSTNTLSTNTRSTNTRSGGRRSSGASSHAAMSSGSYRPGKVAEQNTGYQVGNETPDLQRLLIRAEFIQPLLGKRIVLAGNMRVLSNDQAADLSRRLGGHLLDELDDQVGLLVVGTKNAASTAMRDHATRLNESGAAIEIVDEQGFLNLIVGTQV